jgi:hypothetical protein
MNLLHHTEQGLTTVKPLTAQCPIQCFNMKDNCVDRDYKRCNFFANLLIEYCDRKLHHCGECEYFNYCLLDRKKRHA